MKKILGSLLFLVLTLNASYKWEAKLNKTQIYTNEVTKLSLKCIFSDSAQTVFVELEPPESEYFTFALLTESNAYQGQRRVLHYEYAIFAKKEGEYDLVFTPLMQTTTKELIENTIIGRDNVQEDLQFKVKKEPISLSKITVKKSNTPLSGVFDFKVEYGETTIKAFAPLQLKFQISGYGNMLDIKMPTLNIEGVKLFASEVEKNLQITKDGYKGELTQALALVSDKDFILPSFIFTSSRHYDII